MDEVGKVLPGVFKKQVQRADPPLVEILAPLWSRVAGSDIARHSQPVAFVAGALMVGVADPTWAKILAEMTEKLRAKINIFLGQPVVRAVRVREVPRLARPTLPANTNRQPPSPIEPARVDWASTIEKLDPEIARIVRLSYVKYFARSGRGIA